LDATRLFTSSRCRITSLAAFDFELSDAAARRKLIAVGERRP
jgi:hypothetical protein